MAKQSIKTMCKKLRIQCCLVALLVIAGGFTVLSARVDAPAGPRFLADRLGPKGTVILLNNCDASDMPRDAKNPQAYIPDNMDCLINGEDDKKQIEKLQIQRSAVTGPVTLKLVNYDPGDPEEAIKKVRIFNAKGQAIIGLKSHANCDPGLSDTYTLNPAELKQLAGENLTFYAEGLQFAVTARLQLFAGKDKVDELVLHVAPFLLLPHTQTPLRNMVVRVGGNDPSIQHMARNSKNYVSNFEKGCLEARALHPTLKRMDLHVFDVRHEDVWIQDEVEWGYTETPRCLLPVALHMHRQRFLQYEVRGLLAPGVGYFRAFDYPLSGNGLDYGGNLEVTPATEKYPFGRVYYGSTPGRFSKEDPVLAREIDKGFQRFFKRQKRHPDDPNALQEPIDLSTSWLAVGHIDEIVSFVPSNNQRGFVLLWASPELALSLLNRLPFKTQQDPNYLDSENHRYLGHYGVDNVKMLLDGDLPKDRASFLQMDLVTYNRKVEQKIRHNVAILQKGLGLADSDIKAVPVLFCNAPRDDFWAAEALTPGMVNLSSMDRVSLVPHPFIPVFKRKINQTFQEIGQTAVFIDDWSVYHIQKGEVHCGSNMLRQPFERKWWKQERRAP